MLILDLVQKSCVFSYSNRICHAHIQYYHMPLHLMTACPVRVVVIHSQVTGHEVGYTPDRMAANYRAWINTQKGLFRVNKPAELVLVLDGGRSLDHQSSKDVR